MDNSNKYFVANELVFKPIDTTACNRKIQKVKVRQSIFMNETTTDQKSKSLFENFSQNSLIFKKPNQQKEVKISIDTDDSIDSYDYQKINLENIKSELNDANSEINSNGIRSRNQFLTKISKYPKINFENDDEDKFKL